MNTDVDVLIIGAGPAGCVAASLLHREGFKVRVIEKQRFPRFIIGESLLPHCMDYLQEAGLLEAVAKENFIQKNGAVFHRDGGTCNFDFSAQFTEGWKYTWQVTRAEFDLALANAVKDMGVEVLFERSVTSVEFLDSHATATISHPDGSSQNVTAKFIMDCSGYGRVLPRLLDLERPSNFPVREALFAHVTGDHRPEGREEGKIWACLHPSGAWLWIIPFSNGRTSVGVVATPEIFAQFPGNPEEQLRAIVSTDPSAGPRLRDIQLAFAPQRIVGFSCGVKQIHGRRYALVGNATEFLDPIFSSGVTLALASASRAAKTLTRELRGETVNWQSDYADWVMGGINAFRAYVAAWYDGTLPDIFFNAGRNRDIMRQVCSVLAGYVWDKSNPYVTQPERALPLLSRIIKSQAAAVETATAVK